jgi:hypothetical protein
MVMGEELDALRKAIMGEEVGSTIDVVATGLFSTSAPYSATVSI